MLISIVTITLLVFYLFLFIDTAFTTLIKGRKENKADRENVWMIRTTELGSNLSVAVKKIKQKKIQIQVHFIF